MLLVDDDSRERESILAVYSALFTYFSDPEKSNDILKNALYTSKNSWSAFIKYAGWYEGIF